MNEQRIKELLNKLDNYIDSAESVSPTLPGETKKSPGLGLSQIVIEENMDLEALTDNQKLMIHAMLHNFYGKGGTKKLSKQSIEMLHKKLKPMISHYDFDSLDRV